jgi:hypothetical protein
MAEGAEAYPCGNSGKLECGFAFLKDAKKTRFKSKTQSKMYRARMK